MSKLTGRHGTDQENDLQVCGYVESTCIDVPRSVYMGPCIFQDSHYTAFFLEFNAWTITLYCMNYLVAFNSFKKFTYRCTQTYKF